MKKEKERTRRKDRRKEEGVKKIKKEKEGRGER